MEFLASVYGLVFLGAAALYVIFYLLPLLSGLWTLSPRGLGDLVRSVRDDLETISAEARPGVPPAPAIEDEDAGSEPEGEAADAGGGQSVAPQRWAAERLSRLAALKADYSGVVQEAVDAVQSQYPDGAYQRFEIERLPTVAAFSERVGAARTMAGLFVLIGLLFTMIRLNGVVGGIAEAAAGQVLEPAEFLARMGELMDGIGGAFDSSIYGLALLVLALMVVGAIDWIAQRHVLRLERTVTHEVVPPLAQIHDRLQPNLTLADLLADTGAHLDRLGRTVDGLTGELDQSLSVLGDRIETMMHDFESFQENYAQLDDLLKHMRRASKSLADTSDALEGTAKRIGDPLTGFNKTLLAHVETVVDWVDVSREGFDRMGRELAATREHTDRLVEGLARAAEDGFGEALREHHAAIAAIERQATTVGTRLGVLASTLEAERPAGDGASYSDGEES